MIIMVHFKLVHRRLLNMAIVKVSELLEAIDKPSWLTFVETRLGSSQRLRSSHSEDDSDDCHDRLEFSEISKTIVNDH